MNNHTPTRPHAHTPALAVAVVQQHLHALLACDRWRDHGGCVRAIGRSMDETKVSRRRATKRISG